MKKTLKTQSWLRCFFILTLVLVLLLSGLMYIVDPFFQFRVRDNSYMLNPRYVNPGLIENYDYDTLIIGSSMTQNFDMDIFRAELGAKPLHVSLGGITPAETVELLELAEAQGRAHTYYIGIDFHSFGAVPQPSHNPDFLLEQGIFSTARYLLCYEAWFRFLPVDMGFLALNKLGIELPPKFAQSCSIDMLANWELGASYGEDVVLAAYKGSSAVSEVELDGLEQRFEDSFRLLFDCVSAMEEEIVFFFPPYSMLYWHDADEAGYMDIYLDAKAEFIARAEALGCRVFDFQADPLCADLNNYKDATHHSGEINDYMTRCFASAEHLSDSRSAPELRQQLLDNLESFRAEHRDILE